MLVLMLQDVGVQQVVDLLVLLVLLVGVVVRGERVADGGHRGALALLTAAVVTVGLYRSAGVVVKKSVSVPVACRRTLHPCQFQSH